MMQNGEPAGSSARALSHGRSCCQPHSSNADLGSPPALSVTNPNRSARHVKAVLGERERLLDAQPGAPQHDDNRAQPPAVTVIGGLAHHRDDLLHPR